MLVYCIEVEHVGKKPDLIWYETWRVLSPKGLRLEFGSGKLSLPQSFVDQKLVCFTDMFSSGVLPHRCIKVYRKHSMSIVSIKTDSLILSMIQSVAFNPLSPDKKMYILPTVLHTFLMELVRRICLNIKTSYHFLYSPHLNV